jgi:2-oxoisovalerate dehydrogenase E1 component
LEKSDKERAVSSVKKDLVVGTKKPSDARSRVMKSAEGEKYAGLTRDRLLAAYKTMLICRRMDEKIMTLLRQGKIFFHIGGSGHEAIQVAAAIALRPGHDWGYPYYRDLGFAIQLGVTPEEVLMSAFHRAADPSTGGRQMPGHYGHQKLRIPTQSSATGSQYLEAVGTALGAVKEGTDEVVYVSGGEGSTSEGEFHEAVNWASREKLPVIFCIQNNHYAISVPLSGQTGAGSVSEMMSGFKGLHGYHIDGTDFITSYQVAVEAVGKARRGEGPSLIDADVVRLLAHSSSDDQAKYRNKEELEEERKRDPIPKLRELLLAEGLATDADLQSMREDVIQQIDQAADRVESLPLPDPNTVERYVYSPNVVVKKAGFVEPEHKGARVVLVDAVNHALAEELERNPNMIVYGEDVAGSKGGVFTATKGLTARFGEERVFNSPLAEASIVGTAIGLAVRGFKPVIEIQFADYIWPAMLQLRNELAMFRYRSNNTWACPVVIRAPVGGYIHGGHYHSQSIESIFAHIPGIRLCLPSNAADAKGLLKTACREEDPVLFMEHKALYRQSFAASAEPDSDYLLPFGLAKVKREGTDISVITYGMMVQRSLEAAQKMEERGVSVEVIDLRTLNPLDTETMVKSAKKTGKVLIVHEDTLTAGFGGELAAIIAKEAFQFLDAPIQRVGAKDTPIPYSPPLEDAVLPGERNITAALEELASY